MSSSEREVIICARLVELAAKLGDARRAMERRDYSAARFSVFDVGEELGAMREMIVELERTPARAESAPPVGITKEIDR